MNVGLIYYSCEESIVEISIFLVKIPITSNYHLSMTLEESNNNFSGIRF